MILTSYSVITYTLLSISLISILSWFLAWKKSMRHLIEYSKKVPYPKGTIHCPIIGHAHMFLGGTKRIFRSISMVITENYDNVCCVWLAHRAFFVVSKPELMEIILNHPNAMAKDDLYRFTASLAGEGVFAAPVEKWRKNRKIINPTFSKKNIEGFLPIFSEKGEILAEILGKYEGKGVFDIYKSICNYNVDVICESAMGITMDSQKGDSTLTDIMSTGFVIVMNRIFNVFIHPDFIFRFTKLYRIQEVILPKLHTIVNKVITQKRKEFEERKKEKLLQVEAEIEESPSKMKALLELLIDLSSSGVKFTDTELRDEVSTFLIAGSDTTAVTMSFVCLMLGMFPELQQKVYEEVIDIIGYDRPVEKDDMSKFVYLEKFIKETMRLFPIGPVIVRKADSDLDIGECVIPKGAGIVLGIIANHRSERIFKDPLKFDPERFNPEEVAKRHPYSYLPFSGGPRNCIGIRHAMMSMKCSIATLVRKLVFTTPFKSIEEIEIQQAVIISSVKGYPITISRRS